MDVWKPTPITSTYRYKYYLLIIDEFSRFTWLYPLETKDQVFSCIKEFQFMIEKSLDSSIKSIQPDFGGKFQNSLFKSHCKLNEINHRFSSPYTPKQNSLVEIK